MGIFNRSSAREQLAREQLQMAREELSRLRSDIKTTANVGSETRHRGASRMLRSMVQLAARPREPSSRNPANERDMLIGRSRDAYRNHMLGRAAINRAATNVVGMGLTVRPNVDGDALGLDDTQTDAINAQLARGFSLVGPRTHRNAMPRRRSISICCSGWHLSAPWWRAMSSGQLPASVPLVACSS